MKRGRVYRRDELALHSGAIDRDLKTLVELGEVKKAGAGLYYRPRLSRFGQLPAEDYELVRSFLKDDDFLLISPNVYNGLGVGLTQVYNTIIVYNRRRHEHVMLDGRSFAFKRPRNYPWKLSKEYLFVDLLNNLDLLTEGTTSVKERIKERMSEMDCGTLLRMARRYGKVATRVFFENAVREGSNAVSS